MRSEVEKIGKHQLEIKATIPHRRVREVLEKITTETAKEIEVGGFRKGHAPKELVRQRVDQRKVYDEAVGQIVSEAYIAVIKEHLLKPIVPPKIEILQFEPEANKDFIFKATTAERPEAKVGDYKKELAKLSGPSLDKTLQTVLQTAAVEIPEILVENEVTRMLSRLVDQTARLGLTIEQYLQSQGKTVEQLRAEYAKQSQENLKTELILEEITKAEKIEVTEKEVTDAIKAAPDEASKKELEKEENKWYIRSVLKRNKTLQRLLELAK